MPRDHQQWAMSSSSKSPFFLCWNYCSFAIWLSTPPGSQTSPYTIFPDKNMLFGHSSRNYENQLENRILDLFTIIYDRNFWSLTCILFIFSTMIFRFIVTSILLILLRKFVSLKKYSHKCWILNNSITNQTWITWSYHSLIFRKISIYNYNHNNKNF